MKSAASATTRDLVDARRATTVEGLAELRQVWSQQPPDDIDASPDYFRAVVVNAAGVIRPHVVHLHTGSGDVLAVARLERRRSPISFGYRTLLSPETKAVVVSFGGLVGVSDEVGAAALLTELLGLLEAGQADVLVIPKVDVRSPIHRVVQRTVSKSQRGPGPTSRRWMAVLPPTLDEFLAGRSRKTRQTFRRQDRHLEEKYGPALHLEMYGAGSDVEQVIADLRAVAIKTYQHGLGASVSSSELELALIREGLVAGWFRAWVLYIDTLPIAFWAGTTYNGVFNTGTPGFDPSYSRDSVGRYTMFAMITDLCRDPEVRVLDFGHGEADYKEAFGQPAREEGDIVIFARRPVPMMINFATRATGRVNDWGRILVSRSERFSALKRRWRNSRMGSASGE